MKTVILFWKSSSGFSNLDLAKYSRRLKKGAAMKKDTVYSLSIQKEIQQRRLCLESEIDTCFHDLGIKTLLHRAGICKNKGFTPALLLFVLILLPMIKESLTALWSGKYFSGLLQARKDTYYRFLNCHFFNWRNLIALLVGRLVARLDNTSYMDKVLIADDTLIHKTGNTMELVSYHFDHTSKRSQLGYQMLQLGYHNGSDFYPVDVSFHTSKNRPNENLKVIDRRSTGWRRRTEAFEKKTDMLVSMIRRCWQTGINARFVLFDSWFAHDKIISQIVDTGYGVICRLKRSRMRYHYQDRQLTISQLWHSVARHELHHVRSWQIRAAKLEVTLPRSGDVSVIFIRWSKKQWHAFLCTETDMDIADILNYYSRRWAIEVYFRDCKQLLGLGKNQSETFDALIAWTSIVMIRYLLLVYILAKRQLRGPLGPLFQDLAYEHLQLAFIKTFCDRLRKIVMLSSQLFSTDSDLDTFFYLIDILENPYIDLA
ncbi:MAG: transposase [Bacteroidales bacterium]|nr:transposase [Bacteroidales bacterium]